MKKYISRLLSVLFACGLVVLLANVSNGNIRFSKKPDALTSATVKKKASTAEMAGVSGNFIVLINKNSSPAGTMEFFEGKTDKRPENLNCSIVKDDKKAEDLIKSIAAGESVHDDALLMLSKAEYGSFDVIVMSKKIADTYTAKSMYDKEYVDVVEIRGE